MDEASFAAEIKQEVEDCAVQSRKGGSCHVILTNRSRWCITEAQTCRLLSALVEGSLSPEAGNYVANAVVLANCEGDAPTADSFSSRSVAEAFELLG